MAYLGYLIAAIKTLVEGGGSLPLNQGIDQMLDTAVRVNTHLLYVSIVLWLLGIVFVVVPMIGSGKNIDIRAQISCCGCFFFFPVILLPFAQFAIVRLNVGMANAFGPSGPIEPTKFWILTAISVLLGVG